MKIVIAGSFAEADKILKLREQFMALGHEVFPTPEHIEASRKPIEAHHKGKGETEETLAIRAELMNTYFRKIEDCDVLYVMNEKAGKEHFGIGAALEVGFAYALDRKIMFGRTPTDGNALSMKRLIGEDTSPKTKELHMEAKR